MACFSEVTDVITSSGGRGQISSINSTCCSSCSCFRAPRLAETWRSAQQWQQSFIEGFSSRMKKRFHLRMHSTAILKTHSIPSTLVSIRSKMQFFLTICRLQDTLLSGWTVQSWMLASAAVHALTSLIQSQPCEGGESMQGTCDTSNLMKARAILSHLRSRRKNGFRAGPSKSEQ
jgi:hypothetical protein